VHISLFYHQGCTLRNTKWIVALVAFTGLDTKLMQQNRGTPLTAVDHHTHQLRTHTCPVTTITEKKTKTSHVDKTVNQALRLIFSLQAFFCAGGATAYGIWLVSECVCVCVCVCMYVFAMIVRALTLSAVLPHVPHPSSPSPLHPQHKFAISHWYLPYRAGLGPGIDISEEAGLSIFSYLILLDLFGTRARLGCVA